jgi:hypothetical protein
MVKGRVTYFPKDVMEEVELLRVELNLPKVSDALKKMAIRSSMFRELKIKLGKHK